MKEITLLSGGRGVGKRGQPRSLTEIASVYGITLHKVTAIVQDRSINFD
ncbi:MAG: hypothetical protein L0Y44_12160 [Phycisphaerales bacterium]|nr:hypothetical protein [Phycisphaerales bacterium]MCI0631394.1 hypothetical protein [Phycisphaerales bacterium]